MTTTTNSATATDTLGVAIVPGDTVTIIAWGGNVRLGDTGRRATVVGITPRGNVRLSEDPFGDHIARGTAVRPGCLAVARRDGEPGHEGNRTTCVTCGDPLDAPTGAGPQAACASTHARGRCTCGAGDYPSCWCRISPSDYHAPAAFRHLATNAQVSQ